jgi:2',3'-cyclic-nucleotide 2'-phosphodiesterase (5'-nucleotidase family)
MITVINAYEASAKAAGRETLRVHAGDMISGTIYYSALGYAPDAAAMNAAQFEAVTLGNHGRLFGMAWQIDIH